MPAGIVTRRVRLRSTRPSPRHVSHGLLDDATLAPAARARRHVDHLPEHRLADGANLAAPVALRTGRGRRPGLGAAAAAGLARVEHPELDLLLGPDDRFLERDPQVVAQVRAGLRPPAPRGGRGRPAEERIEDVAEPTEPGGAEPEVPLAAATDTGPAEHVIALSAVRVGQHLVRLVDLLEALLRRRVRVDVGVPLLGELAERPLDLGVGGAAFHAEDGVVVEFGGHSTVKDTRGRRRTRSGGASLPKSDGRQCRSRPCP